MIRRRKDDSDGDGSWDIDAIDDEFEQMRRYMERRMHEMMERTRSDDIDPAAPFVYGFSMRVGPDGKPVIQHFGNTRPGQERLGEKGAPSRDPDGQTTQPGDREPLTDVITGDESIAITVEVPGVRKEDINLNVTERRLRIGVDSSERRYFKEIELPAPVDPDSAKATYNNGILDITLSRKKAHETDERKVRID